MPVVVERELVGQRGPRADEAHLAADHVYELRQFVDAEAAQDAAHESDALVVGELVNRAAGPVVRGGAIANPVADVFTMSLVARAARTDERHRAQPIDPDAGAERAQYRGHYPPAHARALTEPHQLLLPRLVRVRHRDRRFERRAGR